jgi:hypothetical protein
MRALAIPLAAALLGAGVATAGYALIEGDQPSSPPHVVVVPSGGHSNAQPTPLSGRRP